MSKALIAEKRKAAAAKAAEIKKQVNEYNERKKNQEKDPSVVLWPDNTRSAYDAVNKEYDDLRNEIKQLEDDDSLQSRVTEINEWENRSTQHGRQKPGLDDMNPSTGREYGEDFEDRDEARQFAQRQADGRQLMRSWIASHLNPTLINTEMREACARLGADPGTNQFQMRLLDTEQYKELQEHAAVSNQRQLKQTLKNNRSLERSLRESRMQEMRSMTTGGTGSGAELVPITFLNTFELAMLATSPLFAHIDLMRTESGEPIKWPIGDDTGNEGAQVDEEADINALPQPDAVLQQLTLLAYMFTSRFVKVSLQLNRDSLPRVDMIVAQLLGERLGRIKLQRATTGNGTTQPGGIVTQAAAGHTAAVAAAISAPDTIHLQHSVDPNYRANGQYMAHDMIIKALRLLNDSTGRPLWQSGLKDGTPDTINGQAIIYNQYMASTIATTQITMLYGDFSYYKAREVGSVNIMKLVERFAERLQTGFMAYQAFDGRLQRWTNNAPCPVKRLTQP